MPRKIASPSKSPSFYNLRDHASYGHGGSFTTIREVIDYMNAGQIANPRTRDASSPLRALGMTEAACDDLEAFVADGLHDPELHRYVPAELPSELCGINGDAQSVQELGCTP